MMRSASPRRAAPWIVLLALALCGAALGLVASLQSGDRLLFKDASGQELPYYFLGRALEGPHPGEPSGTVPGPLYPLLVKALGGGRDGGLRGARSLQMVLLGALLPLLSLFAARRLFGRTAGILAGVLTLLLGPVWVHLTWLLPYGWQAALGLLAVGLAAGGPERRAAAGGTGGAGTRAGAGAAAGVRVGRAGAGRALLVGLVIGAARLFGAAWAPFLALAWLAVHLWRRRYLQALAVVAGASILLAAPLIDRVVSRPVASPPLLMGGMESALGFHNGAAGIDPRRGDRGEWRWFSTRDLMLQLDQESGGRSTPTQASLAWYGRTLRWALTHPLKTIGLLALKAWYVVGGYDPPSPESLQFRASQTIPWARLLLPVAALVSGLGLAGLWGFRGRRPAGAPAAGAPDATRAADGPLPVDLAPILTLLAATLLAGMLYYVRSGDRLALLLALTGPAGWAMATIFARRQRLLAMVAGGATILVALPWLILAPRAESAADDRYLLASVMDRKGEGAAAMNDLEQALRLDPSHALARLSLATSLARDGLFEQTIEEAGRVTREQPRLSVAFRILAMACQQTKRYEESAAAYQRLTELEPGNPEAWNNLGTLYVSLNRYEDAVAALQKALALDPNYRSARTNLTELQKRGPEGLKGAQPTLPGGGTGGGSSADLARGILSAMNSARAGDVAAAEKTLDALRERFGASPDLDFAAGTVALQKGDLNMAIELYQRCRQSMRNNTMLLNNLAAAYGRAGRLAEAIPLWEEALALNPDDQFARQNLESARQQIGPRKTP